MKAIRFFCLLCIAFSVFSSLFAQDGNVELNLLAAPATPAATLLGFSPSELDKPRETSELLTSIVNSGGGSTLLPSNYAVEIAPAWLFAGRKIDFSDYRSNNPGKNLWQGLTISAAVRNSAESPNSAHPLTQIAFGIKTSILRGHRFSEETELRIGEAQNILRDLRAKLDTFLLDDSLYNDLIERTFDNPADTVTLNRYRERMYASFEAPEIEKIEASMRDLRFDRVGLKLDLTAGLVQDFPNNKYSDRNVSKLGVWLSGGYEWDKGFSFLGIVRYMQNPDAAYTDDAGALLQGNISTFDAGFRAILAPVERRFTVSAEGMYRKSIEPQVLPATWRFALNAEYKFLPNMSLNFSYGRDYEGVVTRDGNVIALLSLFSGFGNSKPIAAGAE